MKNSETVKYPQYFKSCYIVDVIIDKDCVTLIDSSQNRYYINATNTIVIQQFKSWFNEVFSKGVSQTLTVLQYDLVDVSECETKMVVMKFLRKSQT